MGYAIAEAFADAGAEVSLVSGPVELAVSHPGIKLVRVKSAAEMLFECQAIIEQMDLAVFAAAVADFTPVESHPSKIKREGDELVVRLKPTVDIAAELGRKKRKGQLFIGFALETDEGLKSAMDKLRRKNFDLIILNTLADSGAGFGTDTNKVTMIDRKGTVEPFGVKPKSLVALDIVQKSIKMMNDA